MAEAGQDHLYPKVQLAGPSRALQAILAPAVVRDLHQDISTQALATSVSIDDHQITLVDASTVVVGNLLFLCEGTRCQMFTVLAKATNLLTLDRRSDAAFTTATTVRIAEGDLAAVTAGTLATPQIFELHPPAGIDWEITRMMLASSFAAAADLGKFAGIAALTNGMVIRARVSNTWYTFVNWKTNADIKRSFYDLTFDARSGGGGAYGMAGRGTFTKLGVHLRLNGDNGDLIRVYVQDDITALNEFRVSVQGFAHV